MKLLIVMLIASRLLANDIYVVDKHGATWIRKGDRWLRTTDTLVSPRRGPSPTLLGFKREPGVLFKDLHFDTSGNAVLEIEGPEGEFGIHFMYPDGEVIPYDKMQWRGMTKQSILQIVPRADGFGFLAMTLDHSIISINPPKRGRGEWKEFEVMALTPAGAAWKLLTDTADGVVYERMEDGGMEQLKYVGPNPSRKPFNLPDGTAKPLKNFRLFIPGFQGNNATCWVQQRTIRRVVQEPHFVPERNRVH